MLENVSRDKGTRNCWHYILKSKKNILAHLFTGFCSGRLNQVLYSFGLAEVKGKPRPGSFANGIESTTCSSDLELRCNGIGMCKPNGLYSNCSSCH